MPFLASSKEQNSQHSHFHDSFHESTQIFTDTV